MSYGIFNIKDAPYNAMCDGTANEADTVATQAAINDAVVVNGEVIIPAPLRTTRTLNITGACSIRGINPPGDRGCGYAGNNFNPIPSSIKGSVILPGAYSAFKIDTNDAVRMEKLQISYAQSVSSGTGIVAIRGNAEMGAGNANMGSVFRDLWITNADHSMSLTNFLNFHFDHCFFMYHWIDGLILDNPNFPHYGDSTIVNSLFWGGSSTNTGHILVKSQGGIKVAINKFQAGGPESNAILFQPHDTGVQHFEPWIVALNSMEGQTNGLAAVSANSEVDMTQGIFVGNQVWAGWAPIYTQAGPAGLKWIEGNVVEANVLCGMGTSGYAAILDGWDETTIGGNICANAAGSPGHGFYLGPHTSNIGVQSNKYETGMIPVNNLGTSNIIGGGSS
jgi:hypothetical protein